MCHGTTPTRLQYISESMQGRLVPVFCWNFSKIRYFVFSPVFTYNCDLFEAKGFVWMLLKRAYFWQIVLDWRKFKLILINVFRSGIIFSNHYVHASCSPSRAALLTGRFAWKMGMQRGNIEKYQPLGEWDQQYSVAPSSAPFRSKHKVQNSTAVSQVSRLSDPRGWQGREK